MLARISVADGTFQELVEQWTQQCADLGEDLSTYAAPHFEHAAKISAENPQDPKYGIFGLREDSGAFAAIMHVNVARLPQTDGKTLRLLWVLIAPKYDFADQGPEELAYLSTRIVFDAISLSKDECAADQIKIHCGNLADRKFFYGFCAAMKTTGLFSDLSVRGNWLHISVIAA